MEPIQDLVELALWTPYVKGERIVSLLIIAEPESGKTELMKKYRKNKGVHVRRRFSAYGILRDLIDGKIHTLFDDPKILGHILIYDYAAVFSFKQNTVDATIEFVAALTEEGLSQESSYCLSGDELKEFVKLKGGVIAGINTFSFFTAKGKVKANLYKGGWFSRNIAVSYKLSEALVSKIFEGITRGKYRYDRDFVSRISLELPVKRTDVYLSKKHAKEIEALAREIAEEYSEDLKPYEMRGFRLHKSLISLAKASALREHRSEVKSQDIERIRYLSQWMNLKMKRLKSDYPFSLGDHDE